MVTKRPAAKKTTTKKRAKAKPTSAIARPNLERGFEAANRVIDGNVEWLKDMAKR